jgi:hypothetical protein
LVGPLGAHVVPARGSRGVWVTVRMVHPGLTPVNPSGRCCVVRKAREVADWIAHVIARHQAIGYRVCPLHPDTPPGVVGDWMRDNGIIDA